MIGFTHENSSTVATISGGTASSLTAFASLENTESQLIQLLYGAVIQEKKSTTHTAAKKNVKKIEPN